MPIVPETRSGKIQFYKVHLPVWAEDPTSIGLTVDAVDQLQQVVDEAQAAYAEHSAAQQTARSATQKYHNAVRRMHAGGDGLACGTAMLQLIKSYAQTTGNPGVYTRAHIPAPAKPGRPGSAPAPGMPYHFAATLRQTGEIELTWKCDNPAGTVGTIYQVRRQIESDQWTIVGTVGDKSFVDHSLPPGTRSCTYEVTALRSTGKGEASLYTINFGGSALGGNDMRLHTPRGKLVA